MQNETHNTTQSKSDINRFAEEIREAVAQGGDIEKRLEN